MGDNSITLVHRREKRWTPEEDEILFIEVNKGKNILEAHPRVLIIFSISWSFSLLESDCPTLAWFVIFCIHTRERVFIADQSEQTSRVENVGSILSIQSFAKVS